MKALIVIPVRLTSTRLPNKPLAEIVGQTLVQRVYNQARQSKSATRVVIATDAPEIAAHAKEIGAECVMTSPSCRTGSDRVAEAAAIFESQGEKFDLVANVQGDMPFINPRVIDRVIDDLAEAGSNFGMGTLATPITDMDEYTRPSAVKVVFGGNGAALYFSRAPIPHYRDGFQPNSAPQIAHKHMGLYVFRPQTLKLLPTLPEGKLEAAEKLEQLRALEQGIQIRMTVVERKMVEPSIEVDTPADLERARAAAKNL